MKRQIFNYTVNPTLKQMTLTDYKGADLTEDQILLVIHVPTKTKLYNFADVTNSITMLGNIIYFSASMTGMKASDKYEVYIYDPNYVPNSAPLNAAIDSVSNIKTVGYATVLDMDGKPVTKQIYQLPYTAYPQTTTSIVPAFLNKQIHVTSMSFNPCESISDGIGIKTDGSNDALNLGTFGTFGADLTTKKTFYARLRMSTRETASKGAGWENTSHGAVKLGFNAGTSGKLQLAIYDNAGLIVRGTTTNVTNFNNGDLHQLEFYMDITAKTVRIVVDGVEQAITMNVTQTLGTIDNLTSGFRLGATWYDGSTIGFGAYVFESFRIGFTPTDLIASYKFDENTGTAVKDETGQQADGAFVDVPVWYPIFFVKKEVKLQTHAASIPLTGNYYNDLRNPIVKPMNTRGVPFEAVDVGNYGDRVYSGEVEFVLL